MRPPRAKKAAPAGETLIVVPTEYTQLRHRPGAMLAALVVLALFAAGGIYGAYHYKKSQRQRAAAIELTGGNPDLGAALIIQYGCGGCHSIPGVPRAAGRVGPPLQDIARRVYVAGVLTNTHDRWQLISTRYSNALWLVRPIRSALLFSASRTSESFPSTSSGVDRTRQFAEP
jgi:hypothetical protein